MSADSAKLAYQLILLTNTFLRLIDEFDKKTYTCHLIDKAVSKAVKT